MALLDRSFGSSTRARDLPRAAVEIIARLSAERNRLRDEVARLRAELRQTPSLDDLAQLRAERDALARQLAGAQSRLSEQSGQLRRQRRQGEDLAASDELSRLRQTAERLERAAARLEQASRAAARPTNTTPAPSAAPQRAAPAARPQTTTRPMPRGGGMLAGLLRANVELRQPAGEATHAAAADASGGLRRASSGARSRATSGALQRAHSERALRPAPAPAPQPAPTPQPAAGSQKRRRGGGGFLNGLINQNLGLRNTA